MTDSNKRPVVNVNVGVLGHVDSGKTSLCKALSTTASTAAFDANPQSKERGITLDLGFSSFTMEDKWSFTLVDCPGHSSLIRTVIGGAQIMDIMILVIDINKGMQAQAGECLILAEITSSNLIVALNKVDQVPEDKRSGKIDKATKLLRSTLAKTKFGSEPIVAVSALDASIGTSSLKEALLQKVQTISLNRNITGPFLMAVDHCFTIKGQGTIVTGTIIQGCVKIGDMVEFPSLKEVKKIKSMQCFRVSVNEAKAGDRVGLCVPGLDPSLIERSVICASNLVQHGIRAGIVVIKKVPFFKRPIQSKHRYHISIGYDTITALLTIFKSNTSDKSFHRDLKYEYVDQIDEDKILGKQEDVMYFGLLEFDQPALSIPNSLLIGSDLQSGVEGTCRLAFYGDIVDFTMEKSYATTYLPQLKIFRHKFKEGTLDRIVSENAIIAKGFCKRDSNIDHILGLKVSVVIPGSETDIIGCIDSRFGQTNKVRINLDAPISDSQKIELKDKNAKIKLNFKKYIFTSRADGNAVKLVQS